MKLKIILAWALLCLFSACAFNNDQNSGGDTGGGATANATEQKINPNSDSDGDGVLDKEEINLGRNPFVADLPSLTVKFLQNYKIEVTYTLGSDSKPQTFTLDTKVKDTDSDYKYRIGKSVARNLAFKKAASVGKFSSHLSGTIEDNDLSWVSYPEIDPKLFHMKALEFRTLLDKGAKVTDVKIILQNSIKLNENSAFKEIKNLKLNFYFFNHETENYELLKASAFDQHFQAGIFEILNVEIDHAPLALLKESFFKRGEFIISEVADYEVPGIEGTFKELLGRVRARTVPVLFETPLEEKIYYVSTLEKGIFFQDILKAVIDKNYKVEADRLIEIGQFKNNLSDFTNLKEVKEKDKYGNWYVFTNDLKKSYLDHRYSNKDHLVLSYITGDDLATQREETFYAFNKELSGNQSESLISLGLVNPNSRIDFQVKPIRRFGLKVTNEKFHASSDGSCGNNCTSKAMVCDWDINLFNKYDEPLSLNTDLLGEGEKLSLTIAGSEFKLSNLLKDKLVYLYKVDGNIHITIPDISKIKDIKPMEENELFLKVKSFVGNDFLGVKLVSGSGEWRGFGGCAFNTPSLAQSKNTHVSNESIEIGEVKFWANEAQRRGWKYPLEYLNRTTYFQEISIGISSSIQNYFN